MAEVAGQSQDSKSSSEKFPDSISIIPPPDVRDVIERTVGYIVRSGTAFIQRLQEQRDGKFKFLFEGDPYYEYYEWRLNELKSGGSSISRSTPANGKVEEQAQPKLAGSVKPLPFDFSHQTVPISAMDLEILRTTALYAAIQGKQFLGAVAHRESSNAQFAFLKQGHSLNGLFRSYLEEYKKIVNYRPDLPSHLKERIENGSGNKYEGLRRARILAEYQAQQAEKQRITAEEDEKERIEYAQIDWHDFVVVETVLFSQADLDSTLPAPLSLAQLQYSSLTDKVTGNFRIEEAPPDFEPDADPQPELVENKQQVEPAGEIPTEPSKPTAPAVHAQASFKAPGKIRAAGSSRLSKLRSTGEKMIKSPFTGQLIPESKFEDHKRAMLLDPKWKEQRSIEEQRQASTNLSTAEVEQNLKRLLNRSGADEENEEQERIKRAATEAQWDGRYKTREEAKKKARTTFNAQRQIYESEKSSEKNIGPN